MAFNKKQSEAGWFYHAPARQVHREAVGVPPTSQIPGLCSQVDTAPLPEEPPPRSRIMETDSKYVQLAKRGGREDLLQFNYPAKPSEHARDYPRVDWFYLEDIRAEEAEKFKQEEQNRPSEAYQFLLPDYMVHQNYNGDGSAVPDSRFTPKRAPYGFDRNTAFERDNRPSDKTVKLPEMKHDGYGVRSEKLRDRPVPHNVPMPARGKAPAEELATHRKFQACVLPEEEHPIMSKILSFGYARDWDDVRDKWQGSKDAVHAKPQGPVNKDKIRTEYQSQMNVQPRQQSATHPKSREGDSSQRHAKDDRARKDRDELKEKEMFKLNRFKNVAPKIDSHQPVPVVKAH